jgi:hypothetical protein
MPAAIPLLFLITIDAALLAILAYLLIGLARTWLRPLVAAIGALFPGGTLVKKAAAWYANLPKVAKIALYPLVPVVGVPLAVARAATFIEHRVTQALGTFALGHMKPVAAFMGALATEITALSTQTYALANQTWHALSYLVADTIPSMIEEGIADARVTLGAVTHTLAGWFGVLEQGIDRLRTRVGALEEAFAGIDIAGVTAYIDQSIDRLNRDLLEQLGAATAAIGDRIGALADDLNERFRLGIDNLTSRIDMLFALVAPAAIAAAAVAAVTAFAPELFCRNTRNVNRKMCGLDNALLEAVLALSLAWLVVVDPVVIARAALAAEDVMEPIIREVAG